MGTMNEVTTTFLIPMLVTFCAVFLRGFQHKNVIHNLYGPTFVLSYFIVAGEMLTVYFVVQKGLILIIPCGTAAAFAMILSMYLHNKMVARKTKAVRVPDPKPESEILDTVQASLNEAFDETSMHAITENQAKSRINRIINYLRKELK